MASTASRDGLSFAPIVPQAAKVPKSGQGRITFALTYFALTRSGSTRTTTTRSTCTSTLEPCRLILPCSDTTRRPSARRHDLKGVGDSLECMDSESRPMSLQESPILSGGHQLAVEPRFSGGRLVHGHQRAAESMGIDPTLFNPSPVVACRTSATVPSLIGEETPFIHPAILNQPVGSIDGMRDSATTYTMQHQSDFALDQPSFLRRQPFSADEDDNDEPSLSASTPRDTAPVELPSATDSYESWKQDNSAFSDATSEEFDGFGADAANAQQCRRVPDDGFFLDMLRETLPNMVSDPSEIVKYLKRFPKELLQTALRAENGQDTEPDSNSEDESSPRIQICCPDPDCGKNFSRPCELK